MIPTNTDNMIDSRDVIARIETLQRERDACTLLRPLDDGTVEEEADPQGWADQNPDAAEELAALEAFAAEGETLADWRHGETLIADDYFETYARDTAEELGLLRKCDTWPATCIDWTRAAEELQQDYTPITFDGATYWGRA